MRTIPPDPPNKSSAPNRPLQQELLIHWVVPLPFFGGVYFLGFIMGRKITGHATSSFQTIGGRVASYTLLALILFAFISGLFFILYLLKSLLGINIFSSAHLME